MARTNHYQTSPGRSRNMSAIRSRGNASTELRLASTLRKARLSGWRRHLNLIGSPDFVWPASRVAVFVDGCFWHGCPNCYQAPRRNASYWRIKIERNQKRDQTVSVSLRRAGWRVIRIWECQVSSTRSVRRIENALAASK